MSEEKSTNRLVHETSPYLLQHAHNPVDWYPWCDEALAAAKEQDKPIFLSIGYSACHWCHVMERESFENPATAAVMNELFINIKVDREERPDLDQIYMSATLLITQHGGWPMSVWLSPDLKPFYAGTYFPPSPRHGLPAFATICQYLADAWKNRRQEVLDSAEEVAERVAQLNHVARNDGPLDESLVLDNARDLASYIDRRHGGFGSAPKFPHTTELRFLLRAAKRTGNDEYRRLVELSLEQMIRGGIYDQLAGGFHRYSVDQVWLVPHFEKMLYDNALIPLACLEAAQATDEQEQRDMFRRAATETLDYVLREMTSDEGGFFSTQDADSEGIEGKYFVWNRAEVMSVLGPELGELFCKVYDVTDSGNWEHQNILRLLHPLSSAAAALEMSVDELTRRMGEARCQLLGVRSKRIPPGRDEKILTSWNGMMIDTMAVADAGMGGKYADAASKAAGFVLTSMRMDDGRLYRTYKDGRARLNGYLEDYSFLLNGLVSLYESTFEPTWINAALSLAETMIAEFWDDADGGFFYTGRSHEKLIARGKDPQDGAIPSGNSMAVTALIRLAKLTGREDLEDRAERTLALFRSVMMQSPMASAQMMIAMMLHHGPTHEFAIVGESNQTKQALGLLRDRFIPDKVVSVRNPSMNDEIGPIELLKDKSQAENGLTTYICHDFTCQAPVIGLEALEAELSRI